MSLLVLSADSGKQQVPLLIVQDDKQVTDAKDKMPKQINSGHHKAHKVACHKENQCQDTKKMVNFLDSHPL
jgi:hypothetical protein